MSSLERVLYVEDDPDILAIVRMALEVLGGFETLLCSSGFEAVDQAAEFRPDLIVLDMMMPGMDGRTTLKHLRDQPGLADVPAAFVTAKVDRLEVTQYLEIGVIGVIKKPFDPLTLATQLRRIWESAAM